MQITYVHKTQPCWNTSSHPHPIPHYSPLPLRHSERVFANTASPRSPLRTTSSTSCCSSPAPGRSCSPPSPSPSTHHHIHSHLRFATTVSTAICDCPKRQSASSASPPQWARCAGSQSGRCISPSSSRTTTCEEDTQRQPRPHTRPETRSSERSPRFRRDSESSGGSTPCGRPGTFAYDTAWTERGPTSQ